MLKAIELENFKAFGERARIEFAPITLIFGENSAGKSSILQSLSLLKQTRESREHGGLLHPRTDSGTVDLGSFQEMLFDHDTSRRLNIRLVFSPEDAIGSMRELTRFYWRKSTPELKTLAFEAQFAWKKEDKDVQIAQLLLGIGDKEDNFAGFESIKVKKSDLNRFSGPFFYYPRGRHSTLENDLRAVECKWVAENSECWDSAYQAMTQGLPAIRKGLEKLQKETESGRLQREIPVADPAEFTRQFADSVSKAIQFYTSPPKRDAFISRLRESQLSRRVLLDGFLPIGPLHQPNDLPEEVALERTSRGTNSIAFAYDAPTLAAYSGRLVEATLESLFPMGPFRRPPERWYIYTGTRPQDVGYKGELLPDLLFRSPELVKNTNEWLKRLGIGYEIEPRPVGDRSTDLFEVRLRDTRRSQKVDVALSDVGFGISQLLPFVVQSLATDQQIISIEQPEVHIHPRLQADLGDLLAEAIKKPRCHRFIIETHSEHLVLRLQKLVRQRKLAPDDVSIIYVSRGQSGAVAQRLTIDNKGEFIDDWPGGFFPERLKELL